MDSYWLIYVYKNKVMDPRVKRFDFAEDIQPWIDERKNLVVLDCVEVSDMANKELINNYSESWEGKEIG